MLKAYVDGSVSKANQCYSYGVVLIEGDSVVQKIMGRDDMEPFLESHQIAGECYGVLMAMAWAVSKKYKQIEIYYDYTGLMYWALGKWKTNKPVSQWYKQRYDELSQHIAVEFVKVKAHAGNTYNEMADQLAKEGSQQDKLVEKIEEREELE